MTLSQLFCIGFSTPETKLFILFWYYISAFLAVVTYLTANLQSVNSTFESLEDYLECSISGYRPECDIYKKNIEDITRPSYYLDFFSTMMACLINVAHLLYAIQFYDVKSAFKKFCF